MGCSPSKGKLFSKPEAFALQNAVPADAAQKGLDCRPAEVDVTPEKNEENEEECPRLTEEHHTQDKTAWSQLTSNTTVAQKIEDIKETEVNSMTQEIISDDMRTDKIKKEEKQKKNKSKKRSAEKRRKSSVVQAKIEFPPHMVRAHHAAYNFLNPNISKYETLLHLLDQAAQTQLSLQPMMSALVLRFEEVNQALDEMAEEGELMLKEHGEYMALPSGMMGQTVTSNKPGNNTVNLADPSPDLLQQLLHQSAEKIRLVAGSVQGLGDKTLEEAVDYFSSLSKLLVDKLQTKQAAERRLAQVLARVEKAAIRGSNPEDSALHSEDSGIGGENESLTGSERHRRHRGSTGSGSCGSAINIRGALDNISNNLAGLVGHNEDDEEEEDEEEQDEEEYEDDGNDRPERKRSNSSPPDPSQALLFMHANSVLDPAATRPMTAAKPGKSSSSRGVNVTAELQKSLRDLDQKMKNLSEIQFARAPHLQRTLPRRHSLNSSSHAHKSPMRTNQSPYFLPAIQSQQPKRHCVRRLINTFSQGTDGRPGQSLANIPPHIRRPNKSRILLECEDVSNNEGTLVINGNNNNNSWPDGKEDLDMENLPPPPPEVLMDNSFHRNDCQPENEEKSQEENVRILPVINQKTGNSQRLKMPLQNVEVLPNKANVGPRSISMTPAQPISQEEENEKLHSETDTDQETEKETCLYQQAQKMIHMRNAVGPFDERNTAEPSCIDSEITAGTQPVKAPPVSRVRLPPSCPSVRHRFPSPPVFRPQSTSRPSSRPSSPRAVVRATDSTVEEIIPSVTFRDARSVFCRNEMQNPQPFGSSVLPRKWGENTRGRLPSRASDSSGRRTQSEQRPRCQYSLNSSQGE